MKFKSGIYFGRIRHRRMRPVKHEFTYRLAMMYLDLAELPQVFAQSRLFSCERRAVARFCREDHLGSAEQSLDASVRDLVEQREGWRPGGPIRLLTHLRYLGYVFNPVSFYYCFNEEDTQVECIVAEVNNTPWGEQHCYVLKAAPHHRAGPFLRFEPTKEMHVSPFMPMDVDYDWRFGEPGDMLSLHMENHREGHKLFDATLVMERREIQTGTLLAVLLTYPLMTVKVIAAIHWQAFKLWLKRCPTYTHPRHEPQAGENLSKEFS